MFLFFSNGFHLSQKSKITLHTPVYYLTQTDLTEMIDDVVNNLRKFMRDVNAKLGHLWHKFILIFLWSFKRRRGHSKRRKNVHWHRHRSFRRKRFPLVKYCLWPLTVQGQERGHLMTSHDRVLVIILWGYEWSNCGEICRWIFLKKWSIF